ncbi:MAG: tetratricopeptide repeat protein [Spirochaetes bacterium]|nr:tetratricopeptide repeat protein [Spirochaetota bacterium]
METFTVGNDAIKKNQQKIPFRQKVCRTVAFAYANAKSPAAVMNNRGVLCALEGRFVEAEVLFKESLKEDFRFAAAMNNLGVMYDVLGNRNAAFEWLSKACLVEPDNDEFRKNFLSACESGIK